MFDIHLALPGAWIGPELCSHIIQTLVETVTLFSHPFAEIPPVLCKCSCCVSKHHRNARTQAVQYKPAIRTKISPNFAWVQLKVSMLF